jgi:hypothetical protein
MDDELLVLLMKSLSLPPPLPKLSSSYTLSHLCSVSSLFFTLWLVTSLREVTSQRVKKREELSLSLFYSCCMVELVFHEIRCLFFVPTSHNLFYGITDTIV